MFGTLNIQFLVFMLGVGHNGIQYGVSYLKSNLVEYKMNNKQVHGFVKFALWPIFVPLEPMSPSAAMTIL